MNTFYTPNKLNINNFINAPSLSKRWSYFYIISIPSRCYKRLNIVWLALSIMSESRDAR